MGLYPTKTKFVSTIIVLKLIRNYVAQRDKNKETSGRINIIF